jgi:hypothetical protein
MSRNGPIRTDDRRSPRPVRYQAAPHPDEHPHRESNPDLRFRRPASYPLDHVGLVPSTGVEPVASALSERRPYHAGHDGIERRVRDLNPRRYHPLRGSNAAPSTGLGQPFMCVPYRTRTGDLRLDGAASTPTGPTGHAYPGEESNLQQRRSERRASTVGLPGHVSAWSSGGSNSAWKACKAILCTGTYPGRASGGSRTRTLRITKPTLCRVSFAGVEPAARVELATLPLQGERSDQTELHRRAYPRRESNAQHPGSRPGASTFGLRGQVRQGHLRSRIRNPFGLPAATDAPCADPLARPAELGAEDSNLHERVQSPSGCRITSAPRAAGGGLIPAGQISAG